MNRTASLTVSLVVVWQLFSWLWVDATSYGLMSNESAHDRHKRNLPLVFPEGGISKTLLGFAVPIKNPANLSLIFALNFQYQYPVPPNITFFSKYYPYVVVSRKKRSEEQHDGARNIFYKSVESTMDRFGVDGRNCLLRTICEAAETPIHHNGLIGEIFHLLLTPKDGDTPPSPLDASSDCERSDYASARRAGELQQDCRELYPECPLGNGLFDHISILG